MSTVMAAAMFHRNQAMYYATCTDHGNSSLHGSFQFNHYSTEDLYTEFIKSEVWWKTSDSDYGTGSFTVW